MGMRIVVPYVRSSKHSCVIKANDTIIELLDDRFEITIDSVEEVPVDIDDVCLGVKEKIKNSQICGTKESIVNVEWGWDDNSDSYDFCIFGNGYSLGYNCESKEDAIRYYKLIKDWRFNA